MSDRDLARISEDPEWMPHRYDAGSGSVRFVRVPLQQFSRPGFLFQFEGEGPGDTLTLPVASVVEIAVPTVPLHFIFHTAFCRSTLLARALNIHGHSIGMSEPGIVTDLASAGPVARPLVKPLTGLLARKRDGVSAIFVKPTNHANRLIPALLEDFPDARGIMMTNGVAPFLQSVRRKGLMGHRWGRRLYLEMQGYAGVDFGMAPEEVFAMTDLQAAGLAWLLNQNYFTSLVSITTAGRLAVLDGDFFDANREQTVDALFSLAGMRTPEDSARERSLHEAFGSHAKSGDNYIERKPDPVSAEEIEQVSQWLSMIAEQLGIAAPVKQTLL